VPYNIRKQKCKQSDGDAGEWVLSYTDKSGKKHRACHTSKKKAKGQIAAIEMRREGGESTNEKLVESLIEELINEEIVTVYRGQRGDDSAVYDVEFGEGGSIAGKPADLKDMEGLTVGIKKNKKEVPVRVIDYIRPFTSVPAGAIVAQIRNVLANGGSVLADASNPQDVVAELNTNWLDALDWNPGGSRVGRGEAAAKLAFKQDQGHKEPDFVSNGVKLSIKYFGPDGKGTVKSGEKSKETSDLTKKLLTVLKSAGAKDASFPQGSWKAEDLRTALLQIPDERARAETIEEVRQILNALKNDLCTAHGAQGIIAISGAYELITPAEAADKLFVLYIRNSGTRAEFGGPMKGGSSATFESVLASMRDRTSTRETGIRETTSTRGNVMSDRRLRVTERQLRMMIRESLQREGFMDSVKSFVGMDGKLTDVRRAFDNLGGITKELWPKIEKSIKNGIKPSLEGEGLKLTQGLRTIAAVRIARTVIDQALQAAGEDGMGRYARNPWQFDDAKKKFFSAQDLFNIYLNAEKLVTSGNATADAKAAEYIHNVKAGSGYKDDYLNGMLDEVILAVQNAKEFRLSMPTTSDLHAGLIDAALSSAETW
jgi:hypothetical protein